MFLAVGLNIKLYHPFCIAGCSGQPTPGVSIWKYELEQEAWLHSAAVAATCSNRHRPSPDMYMLCRTLGCSGVKVADHVMSGQGQGHAISSIIGHIAMRQICVPLSRSVLFRLPTGRSMSSFLQRRLHQSGQLFAMAAGKEGI